MQFEGFEFPEEIGACVIAVQLRGLKFNAAHFMVGSAKIVAKEIPTCRNLELEFFEYLSALEAWLPRTARDSNGSKKKQKA